MAFDCPKTVRIGYADYNIVAMEASRAIDGDHAGVTHTRRLLIEYCPFEPDASVVNTVLHEILHGCWGAGSLPAKAKEEKVVSVLANMLCQVIRDNPALIVRMVAALAPPKDGTTGEI